MHFIEDEANFPKQKEHFYAVYIEIYPLVYRDMSR